METIGIHDMHDAGAGAVSRGSVLGAINEERFTKRKNEIGFPERSARYIRNVIESSGEEISAVAVPWISGSAIFGRIFPGYEDKRRALWRRELPKPSMASMRLRNLAFKVVQDSRPRWLWHGAGRAIGGSIIGRRLSSLGINAKISFVDHHTAHAASAYYASGFKEALVITLDGAGDGLSGSVSIGENGELKRIREFRADASLGILYGAATLACDMRYSEDEGKLMSLAAYSYPAEIKELSQISRYDEKKKALVSDSRIKYEFLLAEYMREKLLWRHGREEFAYAVQRHLENQILKIVKQHVEEYRIGNVALAGGIFSNVIVNMLIGALPEVKDLFVFPHMGDGGLAIGAAYYADFEENGKFSRKQIESIYYGPQYNENGIEEALKKYRREKRIEYERTSDISSYTADKLVDENEIMLWFEGGMEYGPRALGCRSVLSMPNNPENRNRINLIIKKRPYYQPFASTVLEEEAGKLLERPSRSNRFMTVGYKVREGHMEDMVAASHIDGTTRPQMLGSENQPYRRLLERVRKKTGIGALLNTSLNKHGRPIAMNPDDAVWTLLNTGATTLSIGPFFVQKKLR